MLCFLCLLLVSGLDSGNLHKLVDGVSDDVCMLGNL